jgi:hypothetical protein
LLLVFVALCVELARDRHVVCFSGTECVPAAADHTEGVDCPPCEEDDACALWFGDAHGHRERFESRSGVGGHENVGEGDVGKGAI